MAPSSIVGLPSPRTPSEPPTPPPRDDASDLLSASVFSSHWYGEDRKPLRVKGVLVKKDGSRRRSLTKVLTGRATWSERHFFLDVAAGKLSYFYDAGLARRAGVVRLEPFVSAARPLGGPDHEFEILHSRDEGGAARDGGFLLRAPSAGIMGEWLESLRRSVREVSLARPVSSAKSAHSGRCATTGSASKMGAVGSVPSSDGSSFSTSITLWNAAAPSQVDPRFITRHHRGSFGRLLHTRFWRMSCVADLITSFSSR